MLYRANAGEGRSAVLQLAAIVIAVGVLSALMHTAGIAVLEYSSFRFSRIAAGDIHVDVLVAGNSRARDLLLGTSPGSSPSVFNLAYNGVSREDTIAWIKTFFRQGNTASTVVIETSAIYDGNHFCDSKPYWTLYPELSAAKKDACVRDVTSARWFPLTQFNSEQFLRAFYYLALKPHGDQSWSDDYSIPSELCARLPLDNVFAFRQIAMQLDRQLAGSEIAELKRWLVDHHYRTELVFVLAPFFASPRARPAIADMESVDARLLAGERNLSLATALGDDCGKFADSEHLAANGRLAVAPMVFEYLQQLHSGW